VSCGTFYATFQGVAEKLGVKSFGTAAPFLFKFFATTAIDFLLHLINCSWILS